MSFDLKKTKEKFWLAKATIGSIRDRIYEVLGSSWKSFWQETNRS